MKSILSAVFIPSQDVVAREIEGELIIVPIVSGIGDLEDELYTLNEYGRVIWNHLDGKSSLSQIAAFIAEDYEAPLEEIEGDVEGFVQELAKRRIVNQIWQDT